jgi:hypothetical protein
MTVVIEALCIVFGRKPKKVDGPRGAKIDDYWSEAKVLLNDTHFLQKIAYPPFLIFVFCKICLIVRSDFDKDNIPEEIILKLKPYINNPQFVPAAVEKISFIPLYLRFVYCDFVTYLAHANLSAFGLEHWNRISGYPNQLHLNASNGNKPMSHFRKQ